MPLMQWDASLDVGVESMNREHREILELMNKLFDARAQGQSGSVVNLLVSQLGGVCTRHFADEEALMRRVAYPGLGPHQQLHQKLLTRFTEYAGEIKARGGVPDDAFFNFLKFWLSSHIRGIDTKYAEHVRRGAAA